MNKYLEQCARLGIKAFCEVLKGLTKEERYIVYESNYYNLQMTQRQLGLKTKENEDLRKQSEALDVIKNKDVNIYYLRKANTVDEYNSGLTMIQSETIAYITQWLFITKAEFELLKEVLKWQKKDNM